MPLARGPVLAYVPGVDQPRRDPRRRSRLAPRSLVLASVTGLASVACALGASTARGDDGVPAGPDLRYDLRVDLPVTVTGGVAWVGSELLKAQLAPLACRWCGVDGLDSSVRGALRWSNTGAADVTSSVVAFSVVPVAALGLDALAASREGHLENAWVDALVMVEATVVASDVNQATKFAAARERPFVHALPASMRGGTSQPADNNLSFFSGHTTETFALAASSGTVATLRRYRLAPLIWASGLLLATATGYLRIAADRHYLTDVLVGALAGGGVGTALPLLLHSPATARGATAGLAVRPYVAGTSLGVAGVF